MTSLHYHSRERERDGTLFDSIYLSEESPGILVPLFLPYFFFPKEKGTYLYLTMCAICLFIVTKNNTHQ